MRIRVVGGLVLAMVGLTGCLKFGAMNGGLKSGLLTAQGTTTSGVFELADPSAYSQVVAISDVHGMYDPLVQLLSASKLIDSNQRWIGGRTVLVVVGDSIDKGPKSIEVLDLWMALTDQAKAAGGLVVHTLGNHEAEFLASPTDNAKAAELLAELQQRQIPVTDLTDPTRPRGAFLHQMPVAARIGQWLFCHAGLYPDLAWSDFKTRAGAVLAQGSYGDPFFADPNSILEAKDWWTNPATRTQLESRLTTNGMFGIVQGHQPKAYNLPNTIGAIDGGRLIKIDNGMAPQAGSNPGHLLRFVTPTELTQGMYPHVQVLASDGTAQALTPVTMSSAQAAAARPSEDP